MDGVKRRVGRPKSDKPIKERHVSFRMEEEQYERLKEYAQRCGLTVAESIYKAVEAMLSSEGK